MGGCQDEFLACFFARFGEQKLDIVVDNGKDNLAFIRMIRQEAVEL